ncbi:MAG: MATE family efflux transporter, partial [Reichenbachiella sp.]
MLSQMGHILVAVADSMMVGRLGTVPLASVSLANSVFSVIMLFGLGVSYGMTPLIASADGANDKR